MPSRRFYVRDWKTGIGKGYRFVQFYFAMAATSVMLDVNGNKNGLTVGGRRVRLDQGRRRPSENDLREMKRKDREMMRKRRKLSSSLNYDSNGLDEEGRIILLALGGNDDNIDDDTATSAQRVCTWMMMPGTTTTTTTRILSILWTMKGFTMKMGIVMPITPLILMTSTMTSTTTMTKGGMNGSGLR